MKQCRQCGADFEPVNARSAYCSLDCRKTYRRQADNKARRERYAQDPGYRDHVKAQVQRSYEANRESKLEYQRRYDAENYEARRAYERERQRRPEVQERARRRYHENPEPTLAYMRRYYVEHYDTVDANRAANSARRRGAVQRGDKFPRRAVFDRDGWRCTICGEPIPRDARFPHPGTASIDHIIPLTKGGTHTVGNAASAHTHCNTAKGNRDLTDARRQEIRDSYLTRLAEWGSEATQ